MKPPLPPHFPIGLMLAAVFLLFAGLHFAPSKERFRRCSQFNTVRLEGLSLNPSNFLSRVQALVHRATLTDLSPQDAEASWAILFRGPLEPHQVKTLGRTISAPQISKKPFFVQKRRCRQRGTRLSLPRQHDVALCIARDSVLILTSGNATGTEKTRFSMSLYAVTIVWLFLQNCKVALDSVNIHRLCVRVALF